MVAMCGSPSVLGKDVLRTGLRGLRRAAEAETAGAAELLQAVRADELLERVDLLGRADELEDDRVRPEIRHTRLKHLCELNELRALRRRRGDLQQRELALDRLARDELLNAEHVDE